MALNSRGAKSLSPAQGFAKQGKVMECGEAAGILMEKTLEPDHCLAQQQAIHEIVPAKALLLVSEHQRLFPGGERRLADALQQSS